MTLSELDKAKRLLNLAITGDQEAAKELIRVWVRLGGDKAQAESAMAYVFDLQRWPGQENLFVEGISFPEKDES